MLFCKCLPAVKSWIITVYSLVFPFETWNVSNISRQVFQSCFISTWLQQIIMVNKTIHVGECYSWRARTFKGFYFSFGWNLPKRIPIKIITPNAHFHCKTSVEVFQIDFLYVIKIQWAVNKQLNKEQLQLQAAENQNVSLFWCRFVLLMFGKVEWRNPQSSEMS